MFKKINILRIVLAVLIVFIPLYPKFPLANVTGTYVAIRLDDIIITISLIVFFISQFKSKFDFIRKPISLLISAYFIAIVISFINALLIYQTDRETILLLHLLRRFEYISVFFITLSTFKDKFKVQPFYLIFCTTTALIAIYGYGQKYFRFPVISTMNSEFSKGQLLQIDTWTRISSTFAGHYDLAAFMSVALIIIGGVAILQKNRWLKFLNISLWLVSFHILTLTASRVSVFAFYGGMTLMIMLLRRFLWIFPVTIIFAFSLINSKDLNQRLLATIPALQRQLAIQKPTVIQPTTVPAVITTSPITTTSPVITKTTPVPTIIRHGPKDEYIPVDADVGVARSGEIRFNAEWPRAITALKKNLLFGTGLGSITLATDNDYLRALGESGIVGLVTFLIIFGYFIYLTIKNPLTHNLIFLSAMITFLINATLIDVFEASKTAYLFWIMMGFYYHSLTTNKTDK